MSQSRQHWWVRFLAIAILLLLWSSAHAQRAFAPRFSKNTKGDITFVSNSLMTCNTTAAGCTALQTTSGAAGTNNNFVMQYVNTDTTAGIFSSSSAQILVPAGSVVEFAGLYWAGDSANTARNTVRFKTPVANAYANITASTLDTIAGTTVYQGFADVTALVAASAGNMAGNYTVANVYSSPGVANVYAGWTLVVVYSNTTLPMRNLAVYDGYQRVNSATAGGGINISLSGFLTPPIGAVNTSIGTIGYDGDRGSLEGTAGLQFGQTATSLSPVFNAVNPQNDYFNSTISTNGANVSTRNPAHLNTLGYDADITKPNTPLPNGATSAVVRVSSSSETIDLGVVTLATDIFVPNVKDTLTKKVTDLNGGAVLPGDVLEYELSFGNTGQDPALNTVLTDNIPANTTYLPNSIVIVSGANAGAKSDASGDDQAEYDSINKRIVVRAGVGANAANGGTVTPGDVFTTIRFRVVVNAGTPGDTVIDNFGVVTSKAQTLGTVNSDISDADPTQPGDQPARVIVASPDLVISKTHSGNFFAGQGGITYTLVVTNNGLVSTTGVVTVTEIPPIGLNVVSLSGGANWTCSSLSCTRSSVLPPGASYEPIIVTANVALDAPATLINSASVSGGGEGASKTSNNSVNDTTGIVQGFPVSKSFIPAAVSTMQPSRLSIAVTNLSSASSISGLAVNDPLPSGVVVAPVPNASTSGCGAIVFAPLASATVLTGSGGSIAAGSVCTLNVDVVAANAGAYLNTIAVGGVTTSNAGSNNAVATATLSVAAPDLRISKVANGNFYRGQSAGASFSINVNNAGSGSTAGAVTVVDTLPAGLVPVAASGTNWNCSIATQTVTCSRADVLASAAAYPTITVSVTVNTDAPLNILNTATVSGGGEPAVNTLDNSASAAAVVLAPPVVSKTFTPAVINLGGTATLEITIVNPNAVAITGVSLLDTYPANLLNAASPNASTTCASAVLSVSPNVANAGFSGATVPASNSCVLRTVVAPSPVAGAGGFINTLPSGAVTTANAGSSVVASSATLNVSAPDLTISKSHTGTFYQGQTTATFTIIAANNGASGNGASVGQIAVVDNLPAGLVPLVATGSGWGPGSNSCSVAGQSVVCNRSDVLGYSASYPPITVVARVADTVSGTITNIVQISGGAEPSANAANNTAADTALVLSRPVVSKVFSQSNVSLLTATTLTVVIENPNNVAITGVGFTDNYPAGIQNALAPAAVSTCGGAIAATAAGASLALSGASIAANSSCTVTVLVQAVQAGAWINAIPVGALVSDNAGSNGLAANATLTAAAADLVLSKTHAGNFFQGQTTATFTLSVTNQGAGASNGVIEVTDTLPTGLTPVSAGGAGWGPQAGNRCTIAGQLVTCEYATALMPAASVALTITVQVANNAPTSILNRASVRGGGEPLSAQNNNETTDAVTVLVSPRIVKTFSPLFSSVNQTVTLTLTLFNDNSNSLTGLSLTDNLPVGLLTAGSVMSNTCGGSVVVTGSSVSLAGGTLPAANSSCAITVPVVAALPGSYVNSIPAGGLTSNEAGASQSPAQTTLAVAAANLVISKSHTGSFFQGQTTATYSLLVSNNGAGNTDGSSIVMTDTLPAGLSPINASGLGWLCGFTGQIVTCSRGGVLNAGTAAAAIILTVAVDANASASVVNHATVMGGGEPVSNTTDNSIDDATTILANPLIQKDFFPASVNINQVSVLTVTLRNPNASVLNGLAFNDAYPPGLLNAPVPNLQNTCGGTALALPGTNSLALAGASLTGNSNCVISVQVQGAVPGGLTNQIAAGGLTSIEAGANASPATATLNIAGPDLSITKSHTGTFYKNQIGAQFQIEVRNIGLGATAGTVTVSDMLPGTLIATGISGAGWTCGLSPLQCSRNDSLGAGAVYPPIILVVNVADNAAPIESNRAEVTGGGESSANTANNSATDRVQILANPTIAKTFTPNSVNANNPSELLITLSNPNPVPITGAAFTDNLPAGINSLAIPTGTCGGALGGAGTTVVLASGVIPANGSCVVRVSVSGPTPGGYSNLIPVGGLTTTNAGSNQTEAAANLSIAAPDLIVSKSHIGNFYQRQNTASYTIEVRNIGAGATNGNPITITDTLPAGLTYTGFTGSNWSCASNAATVACINSGGVLSVGASLPILTIAVNVGSGAAKNVLNSVIVSGGGEPTANAGNNTAVDPTKVLRNPLVSKTFSPNSNTVLTPSRLIITITNANDVALTNVAFSDSYPINLRNTANPNAASTCGGTVLAPASPGASLALSGGTVAPNSSCTIEVDVEAQAAGNYVNTLAADSVTTSNAGGNPTPVTANFAAASPDLAIVKLHGSSFYQGQMGGTFTLRVTNVGVSPSVGGVTVTDVVPAGMTLVSLSGASGWSCAGNSCVRTANDGLAVGASYSDITATVNIDSAVSGNLINTAVVTNASEPPANVGNNITKDVVLVYANPALEKFFSPVTMAANDISVLTIRLRNTNAVAITGAAFSDVMPSAIMIASPANAISECGGTVSASAANIQLSGGVIPANGTCDVRINVTSVIPGSHVNTISAGGLTTANAGSNTIAAAATLTVISPDLILKKSHGSDFFQGQSGVTYTFVVTNIGVAATSAAVSVIDNLPLGLTPVSASGPGWSCAVALQNVNCIRQPIDILQPGAVYPPIALTVNVAATAGNLVNTATVSGGGEAPSLVANNGAADPTTVLSPIQVNKVFSPNPVASGQTSTLTISVSNLNAVSINPVSLTDTMPAGLIIAGAATTSCGAGVSAPLSGQQIIINDATVPANGVCAFSVPVAASGTGAFTNTIRTTDVTPNINAAVQAVLTVNAPNLVLSKSHTGTFFAGQQDARFLLRVTNIGNAPTGTTVSVTDMLPTEFVPRSIDNGVGWICSIVSQLVSCNRNDPLASGASYPTISLVVAVSPNAAGTVVNNAVVGGGGEVDTSNNQASDSVLVLRGLTMSKQFGAPSIGPNQTTTLVVSINNSNPLPVVGVNLTDTFSTTPGPMFVVGVVTSTCGGAAQAFAGNTGFSLVGGSISANSGCSITAIVTAAISGLYNNIIPAANLASANAGIGAGDAVDSLTVAAPDMVIAKSAKNAPYFPGQGNALFELVTTNVGNAAANGSLLTVVDTMPTGLLATAAAGIGWNCTVASTTVTCTRPNTLAIGASHEPIQITATVAASLSGALTNTAQLSGGGDNNPSNNSVATGFEILSSPQITKAFAPAVVQINQPVQLTINLTNPNTIALNGVSLRDVLPADMQIASLPGAVSTCGGSLDVSNSSMISLTGATVPSAGCFVRVNVVALNPGVLVNVIPAGALSSVNAGNNQASASATLQVSAPDLRITKRSNSAFWRGQAVGAAYLIGISNIGGAPTTGIVSVQDTLPTGISPLSVVASTWNCSIAGQVVSCHNTNTLAVGASFPDIQINVGVARDAPLSLVNTALVSGGGEAPSALSNNTAEDITTVLANPVVSKRFLPGSISLGQIVTLEVTITNTNSSAITNVAFIDAYPAGLVNAATANASSTCGGVVDAIAGANFLGLSAAAIPSNSTCIIKIDVTTGVGALPGSFINSISAGSVTSANAGNNTSGANALLSVASADLVISKSHLGDFFQRQNNAFYTLSVTNQGSGSSFGTVTVSDILPANMQPLTAIGVGWTCAVTAPNVICQRGTVANDVLVPGAQWPPINISVSISADASSTVNYVTVAGGAEADGAKTNNGASDPTVILANPTVTKTFSVAAIPINTPVTLTLVLGNSNAVAITGVALADSFPPGLVFAASSDVNNTCGGTVVTQPVPAQLSVVNGTIAPNSTCSISVQTMLTGAAVITNALPPDTLISANAGGNAQTASATITGFATEPTGYKSVRLLLDADSSGNASPGDVLEWVVIYANTQNGSVARSGFQIQDTLPLGLTLTSAPAVLVSGTGTSASANNAYNGGGDSNLLGVGANLGVNGLITVRIPVRILPNVEGVLSNQTNAIAPSLALAIKSDAIDNTTPQVSLPPGVTAAPGSLAITQTAAIDPTQINITVPARIGVSKAVNSIAQINGTTLRVTYDVMVKNLGAQTAPNVQIVDSLAIAFPAPVTYVIATAPFVVSGAPLAVNAGYNGTTDIRLLQGNTGLAAGLTSLVRFSINVTLSGTRTDFDNSAFASTLGSGPNTGGSVISPLTAGLPIYSPALGAISTDTSNNAIAGASAAQLEAAIDANNNGRANDAGEDVATPIRLAYAAALRGAVWFDTQPDRFRQPAEQGVQGFGVEVISSTTNQSVPCVSGINTTLNCITMPDGRSLFATNALGNYEVIGVPVGSYRVQFRDGANNIIYGTPVNGESPTSGNSKSTVASSRDGLLVNLMPGDSVLEQSLPLDPSGVVYNSSPALRNPINGAVVTLCGPSGFVAAAQLVGGSSYASVSGKPQCASMVVGGNGYYQYLLQPNAPAGTYTLSATASGFFGPSVVIPANPAPPALPPAPGNYAVQAQATAPTGGESTLYYLTLNLSPGVQDVIHNHIPLDPLSNARLFVTKAVNQRSADVGDSVEYTINVTSPDTTLANVEVIDRLPTGFRLIPRTVRLNSSSTIDPLGAPGPQMTFNVGTVVQNVPSRITYRARVGVGSQIGDGINRARADAPGGITSNVAQAVVKVSGGVFTSDGCIVGKIFVDCNRNHIHDATELGIPGVRLYLEDGTYLISDRDGKYSYCGLTNSTHVLKVDPRTLPEGSRLTTFSNRNIGDAESVLIDMRAGELFRTDFIEGSCKPSILQEIEKRRGLVQPLGDTPKQEGQP